MIKRQLFFGPMVWLLFSSLLFGAGNLVDGDDADLIYNPATGNVRLDAADTNSMRIVSFVLGNDQDSFRSDNFIKPFLNLGTNTDATPFQIGQTDALGGVWDQTKPSNLGNIFPLGMNQSELAEYLTLAAYSAELGGSGGTFDLIIVPESAVLSPVIAGFLLALQSRRRRKPC